MNSRAWSGAPGDAPVFKPAAMQYVTVHLIREDAPKASLVLAQFGAFQPQPSDEGDELLPESLGERYRERLTEAQGRFDKIVGHLGSTLTASPPKTLDETPTEEELIELNDWLGQIWRECSRVQERQQALQEDHKHLNDLFKSLEQVSALDIDLGLLQSERRLLALRVGTVPLANLKRLQEAVALAGFILHVFAVSEPTAHAVLAGLQPRQADIETALDAASWRPLELPAEFKDRPEKVRTELKERAAVLKRDMNTLEQQIQRDRDRYQHKLQKVMEQLLKASAYAELAPAMRGRGGLCVFSGWTPRRDVPRLEATLGKALQRRFILDHREPTVDELALVPSLTRQPTWLRPFATLVNNYGTPRYGEIDPTALFALSFIAMFGMMFGDVGHGAVIAAAGLLARNKLHRFTSFVVLLGLSSAGFGFVYGSVFGYEHIIHPLWMSPFSDPARMLTLALYWGIGFILLATCITIINRIAERRWREALLDSRGGAGMALYLGTLYGVQSWLGHGVFNGLHAAAIVVPLTVILVNTWQTLKAPRGQKALMVFIEGYEALISYLANTLSFLRVAAFSLNHVALAIALFTLAGMMDTAGHWITIVLGNVFILVLEGAIVVIQVLRLEYYEGFSRFFSGDGRAFRPLSVARSLSDLG